MAINKIMVLGAGTMGMGIAQVFAEAGKTVLVRDIADAFIQRGEGVLKKNLEKKVAKGKITEEQKNDMLSRVSFTLELADLVGLDICLAIMETIFTETGDSKYRPALTMKKMVRAGLLGQKTGEGFYKY